MNQHYKIKIGTRLYATSSGVGDASGQWLPEVVGMPGLTRNIGDGKTYQASSFSLSLRNDDGRWSTRLNKDGEVLRGKTVQVWDDEDTLLFTGAVERYDLNSTSRTLDITATDYIAGVQETPGVVFNATDYPNGADEGMGQPIKRIYGTVSATGGALTLYNITAKGVSGSFIQGTFLVADHWIDDTQTIELFDDNGDQYSGTHTITNHTDGRSYVSLSGGTGRPTVRANVTGRVLGAGTFNGTGDYISLGNPAGLQLATGTIVVRAKLPDTTAQRVLVGKVNAYIVYLTPGGKLAFYNYTGATQYISADTYDDGAEHVVVYRFDGTGADMIVDCTETVTGATVPVGQGFGVFLGSTTAAAGFFNGIIRDVQIYNTKATDAQVQELSNGKVLSGCLAHYTFDEGSGTTITDRTGNGYNGTLTTADATAFWAGVAPMDNPADCLRDILAGSNLSYDCASWKATREALATAGFTFAGYTEGQKYQDILSAWGRSFWTDFYFSENGELRTNPPLQSGDLAADADFSDIYQTVNASFSAWDPQYAPETIVNDITINYGQTEYSSGFRGVLQATDSTSVTAYGTCQDTMDAPFIGDATSATALKDAIFADLSTPPVYVDAETADTISSAAIGDYVKVRDVGEYQDSTDTVGLYAVLRTSYDLIHRKRLYLRDVKAKV